ncbi:reverse transcriptase domain-containing protein [Tanacetum coccineum]
MLATRGSRKVTTVEALANNKTKSVRSCTVKCENYKNVGHMTQDCRNPVAANNQRTLACYVCGRLGHYKNGCP